MQSISVILYSGVTENGGDASVGGYMKNRIKVDYDAMENLFNVFSDEVDTLRAENSKLTTLSWRGTEVNR